MPTFDDPLADAAEASAALRGLAHATRTFESPADTHPVIELELQAELFESPEKHRRMTAFLDRKERKR